VAAGKAGPSVWPALLSEACIILFYTIMLRPEPVSRAKGYGPVLLALAGTYGA
jgi:hypothetical protein